VLVLVMMVCVARIESRSTEALVRQERGLLDFFFPLPEITSTKRPVPEYAPSYPSSSKPLQPPRPMPPTKYPQSMEKPYPNQSYLTEARPPYVSKPAEPYTAPVPYKPSGPFNNYQAQNNYNNSYYPEEKPIRPITIHVKIPAPPPVPEKVAYPKVETPSNDIAHEEKQAADETSDE
jgi:hypothetical protein